MRDEAQDGLDQGAVRRRPFARTLTRLSQLCADFVTCGGVRRHAAYGRPMLALLAAALTLVAPVPGPVARSFAYGPDPFRAGWHRGADFSAARGVGVRAACSGRVVWAGRRRRDAALRRAVARHAPAAGERRGRARRASPRGRGGGTGAARATPRPAPRRAPRGRPVRLRRPRAAARRSAARRPGGAASERRVPRAGRPGARCRRRRAREYRAGACAAPPAAARASRSPARGRAARRAARGRAGAAPPVAVPRAAPLTRGAPPRLAPPPPAGPAPAAVRVLAPWPAWLGLAVLLAGAVGGGVRVGLRRRRATAAALARR